MATTQGEMLAQRLQRSIEQIKGVTSARVILDDHNEIAEIHLVGSPDRGPKQIVRDTESLLYARFGLRVDYRRISLVQVEGDGETKPTARLRLVSVAQEGDRVRVALANGKGCIEGTATLAEGLGPAAARATLDALQKVIGQAATLRLQQAQTVALEGQCVFLVVASALTAAGEERLTGTCLIGEDLASAAAKATLDAVNRRLPMWGAPPRMG
jgi:hypothetical protein